jgi:nucleoside-triphosphatase THEP1
VARLRIEGTEKGNLARALLEKLGDRAGGLTLEPFRQYGLTAGFRIRASDGRTGTLAHVAGASVYRSGRYKVNVADIDAIAVPCVLEAIKSREVVVIDEINRMLIFSEKMRVAIRAAFESNKHIVVTLQDKPHGFVDRIRELTEPVRSLEDAMARLGSL